MRVPRQVVATVVTLAVSLAGLTPAGATAMPGPLADFQVRLSALTKGAPGHVGVTIQDVATGVTTGINQGAEMPAASTIKIPVMVEVFKQLGTGRFDLNTRVRLQRSDKDWGSGDLAGARAGTSYPVSRLLALMIDVSDNTATNMLIRLVGRRAINDEMLELGLTHTRLTDFIRSEGPHIRWALRTSTADMAHLLGKMAREQLLDEWSSRAMIAILRDQRHNGLLPEPLPAGTDIAHKTGTLHDTLNDVGIVFLGSDPYVIAVMTTNLRTLDSGRRFIRGVSRMAYDALGKFASWREANGFAPILTDAESEHAVPQGTSGSGSPDIPMWTPPNPAPVAPNAPAASPEPQPPS